MFRKLVIKGMSLDDFKETFGYKKGLLESEKEALFRTAKEHKGKKADIKRKEKKERKLKIAI